MRDELKDIFIRGCNDKIEKKGDNVGLSFYAFLIIKMILQNY